MTCFKGNNVNKKTGQNVITGLMDMGLSKEGIADKFGVSVRTVYRWSTGETKPSPVALKYIMQVYNGYYKKRGSKGDEE